MVHQGPQRRAAMTSTKTLHPPGPNAANAGIHTIHTHIDYFITVLIIVLTTYYLDCSTVLAHHCTHHYAHSCDHHRTAHQYSDIRSSFVHLLSVVVSKKMYNTNQSADLSVAHSEGLAQGEFKGEEETAAIGQFFSMLSQQILQNPAQFGAFASQAGRQLSSAKSMGRSSFSTSSSSSSLLPSSRVRMHDPSEVKDDETQAKPMKRSRHKA
jgi:hypothetical protein